MHLHADAVAGWLVGARGGVGMCRVMMCWLCMDTDSSCQKHLAESAAAECINLSAKKHLLRGEKLSMAEMSTPAAVEALRFFQA